MFSDYQSFLWIAYGDMIKLSLVVFVMTLVIVLIIIVLDRTFTKLLERR